MVVKGLDGRDGPKFPLKVWVIFFSFVLFEVIEKSIVGNQFFYLFVTFMDFNKGLDSIYLVLIILLFKFIGNILIRALNLVPSSSLSRRNVRPIRSSGLKVGIGRGTQLESRLSLPLTKITGGLGLSSPLRCVIGASAEWILDRQMIFLESSVRIFHVRASLTESA